MITRGSPKSQVSSNFEWQTSRRKKEKSEKKKEKRDIEKQGKRGKNKNV
jgi:hypothetical protein